MWTDRHVDWQRWSRKACCTRANELFKFVVLYCDWISDTILFFTLFIYHESFNFWLSFECTTVHICPRVFRSVISIAGCFFSLFFIAILIQCLTSLRTVCCDSLPFWITVMLIALYKLQWMLTGTCSTLYPSWLEPPNLHLLVHSHVLYDLLLSSFYRAMHFSAKRGIAIACRLSVRLSVCLSVCL